MWVITSTTTDPAGKRRTWTRRLSDRRYTETSGFEKITRTVGDVCNWTAGHIPSMFHGCEVTISHSDGRSLEAIVDPDTRQCIVYMLPARTSTPTAAGAPSPAVPSTPAQSPTCAGASFDPTV